MQILDPVDGSFWWEVAEECLYATFFHTPIWSRLMGGVHDAHEDVSVGAVCNNGTKVVLPLVRTGRVAKGMLYNTVSTAVGCYGGPIATGPVPPAALEELYEHVQGWRTGLLQINGNPLRASGRVPGLSADAEREDDFTHILALDRPFEDIVSGYSRGHRSSLKKGRRKGVEVRVAESIEDYRDYFGAYEDSLRRWGEDGTSRYAWELFECGFRLSREHPEQIRLWLAEVEGTVVAGAWVFYWNDHADYWHGAVYEEYFDYRPNNVLHTDIIAHALDAGYEYYDLNPSGGHEGVARFKKRFGAERWTVYRSTVRSPVYSAAARARDLLRA